MNAVSLSPEAGPKGALSFQMPAWYTACFYRPHVKSHVTTLMYVCIFVAPLCLLSSSNKSTARWRALLRKGWNTWDTWEKFRGWKLKKRRAFHLQWEPCVKLGAPAVVLNLCPSKEIEKWPGRPYLTLGLHLPFPLKTTTWCSDKKAF